MTILLIVFADIKPGRHVQSDRTPSDPPLSTPSSHPPTGSFRTPKGVPAGLPRILPLGRRRVRRLPKVLFTQRHHVLVDTGAHAPGAGSKPSVYISAEEVRTTGRGSTDGVGVERRKE